MLLADWVDREKGYGNNFIRFLYAVVKTDSGFMCVQQVRTNVKPWERTQRRNINFVFLFFFTQSNLEKWNEE